MTDYFELLENSYQMTKEIGSDISRLEFLGEYIFDFTTYDIEMSELFARKAVEVCAAINDLRTFEYIGDANAYQWYLVMVNMPFFAPRLNWGSSVRGAWWDHGEQTLESCGIWEGKKQVTSMKFSEEEWGYFVAALIGFSEYENNA